MTDRLELAGETDKSAQMKRYLGEIAIECIAFGQRKDETIIDFIRRLATSPLSSKD